MRKVDSSKLLKIGILVLAGLFLVALVIVVVSVSGKPDKKNAVEFNEDFTLYQPLMVPAVPSLPDDYYLMRERGYKWTQADVDRWFTPPDGQLLDDLHSANDDMITNILEAAP